MIDLGILTLVFMIQHGASRDGGRAKVESLPYS